MKDDEIQKMLLELRGDNIKQERELFKHIAVLSSAIVGVFAFTGNKILNIYLKIGVIGLFVVIIISVFLLFFVLTLERYRAVEAQKMIEDVKKIKNETILKSVFNLVNENNLKIFKKLSKNNNIFDSFDCIKDIAIQFWQDMKSGDDKIIQKKLELNSEDKKGADIFYRRLSVFGVLVFILSLGSIIFGILN